MTLKGTKPAAALARAEQALREIAMSYPGVREDHPWGHSAFKVKNKTFLFLGADAAGLGVSTKLPNSGAIALELPFAEPTHYGLGKSGWVSAHFKPGEDVPLPLLREWIAESFEAIAKPSKAGRSEAVPSKAKPSKAKPSKAKPSQAKPTGKPRAKVKRSPSRAKKSGMGSKPRGKAKSR